MPARKQDAYRALELMEHYLRNLEDKPDSEELRQALTKAIVTIRSRLFQALLDIQEFYEVTLEDASKPMDVKVEETRRLAEKWDKHGSIPIPVEAKRLAQRSIAPSSMNGDQNEDQDYSEEVVIIEREPSTGLGLSIAGGTDNPHIIGEYGIFVTKLIPDTPAEKCGKISLGDQILSVNGVSLEAVTHAECVEALKNSGLRVEMVVRRYHNRTWSPESIEDFLDKGRSKEDLNTPDREHRESDSRFIKVILVKKPGSGLGFSIAGGQDNQHALGDNGIFVTKIIPSGPAEEEGTLAVGDRIIEVDGNSLQDVRHDEAVSLLKATGTKVVFKVEKNALRHVTPGSSSDHDHERSPKHDEAVETKPQQKADEDEISREPRYVTLQRPEGVGLGFNIIGGEEEVGIFISVIAEDGVAGQAKKLNVGDMILEVNDQDIVGWSHETAAKALKTAGTEVTLRVVYKPEEFQAFYDRIKDLGRQSPAPIRQLYVRALFDYDSNKEADRPGEGISFHHGDILHVINGSDEEWWQACLVGSHAEDGPQGLIPSKRRLERRSRANQKSVKFTREGAEASEKRSSSVSSKLRSSFKLKLPFGKKTSVPASASSEQEEEPPKLEEEIPTYEPVSLQSRGYTRPVIILGPLKEDVNDMLVQEFPDKFAGCVPHTTRRPREGEVDGRDYHFVESVDKMERDIQAHLFIEAGRYKDNLYGTSIQAVREVAEQGKHCILGVSGYAIRRLVMADLLPIAICIRPSDYSVIVKASEQRSGQVCVTDEQAQQMLDKGRSIEGEFADSFTAVVESDSLDGLYEKVKSVIHEHSGNFIWVPSNEQL